MTDHSYLFTESEFETRHEKVLNLVAENELAVLFARADMTYYSGTGFDGALVVDEGLTRLVKRNIPLAIEESTITVQEMPSFHVFKEMAKTKQIETLKLELDILPYKTVEYIKKAFGNPVIKDISDDLRMIRSIKSSEEHEMIKIAAKQTDDSFSFAHEIVKPGLTEIEVCAEIERFLRRAGHPGYVEIRMFRHNYPTSAFVMAGESTRTLNSQFGPVSGAGSCKMHKTGPSRRKIKNDEAVLIDTTGVYEGYTADETRTFFLGNVPKEHVDAYEVAKEVQKLAEKLMIDSASPKLIYEQLYGLVEETSFLNNFMGIDGDIVEFIGHGIGLELDEFPLISPKYNHRLVEGQIIALEPKMIFNSPIGGVGIEDDYIVHKNRAERITKTPW